MATKRDNLWRPINIRYHNSGRPRENISVKIRYQKDIGLKSDSIFVPVGIVVLLIFGQKYIRSAFSNSFFYPGLHLFFYHSILIIVIDEF